MIVQLNSINGSNINDVIWQIAVDLNGDIIGISIWLFNVELKILLSLKVVNYIILKLFIFEHIS